MGRNQASIRVQYCGEDIPVERGQRLLDAILESGAPHRHICGGRGFCTSCRVEVTAGRDQLSSVTPLERERLGREAGALRLACQTFVHGNVRVRVPAVTPGRFSPDGS